MSLLLRGARLLERDGGVDVLVEDGRIAAIAPQGRSAESDVDSVDVDGRWIIPGLWDNHVHFTQWARTVERLDVSGAETAAAAAGLVEREAGSLPARSPIVGFGYHDARWPDEPTRELLDAAGAGRPVVLIAGDLHSCWVNTAAAARFAPSSRGAVLRESDAFAAVAALEASDSTDLDEWARQAGQRAAERGVVGIVDLEMTWNLDVWERRIAAGQHTLRVEFGIYAQDLQRAVALGLHTGAIVHGTNGLLTVGPFKIITDGSLNTRTAYCFDPYPAEYAGHHRYGVLTVPTDDLVALMALASAAGIEPAVHAIGDHANRLALDAFEQVGCAGRIEHAQLLTREDVARFAQLEVTASIQPEHAVDDRDAADLLWAGRTDRAYPFAELHAAGARLALGSDAPVARLDPWVSIAAAVARTNGEREAWHPENALSRQVALTASTRSSVAVGEVADLAIVDADPLACTIAELRRMPVAATLLGGRFTHNRLP